MNLGTTRLRGRPRNRWQGEVKEDRRIVGGEGWQEKVHNREESSHSAHANGMNEKEKETETESTVLLSLFKCSNSHQNMTSDFFFKLLKILFLLATIDRSVELQNFYSVL